MTGTPPSSRAAGSTGRLARCAALCGAAFGAFARPSAAGDALEALDLDPAEVGDVATTFWEMLRFGWPINLILGVLAFFTLFLFFLILIATRGGRVAPAGLVRRIRDDLASGAYETAQARLEQYPCLFSGTFLPGLLLHGQSIDRVHKAVEAAGRRAAGALRNRAGALANIGVIAPMLGLLGTVLGLMKAFNALTAEIGAGTRTPILTGAIGEAMVTTAVGLIVGIPAMALYFIAMHRIAKVSAQLEEAAESAVGTLEDMKNETPPAPERRPGSAYV